MPRIFLFSSAVLWLFAAACSSGEPAADAAPRMDRATFEAAYCGGPRIAAAGDVLHYTGPVDELELAVTVQLEAERVILDGVAVAGVPAVRDMLIEKRDEAVAIAALASGNYQFEGRILFLVPPGERAHRVAGLAAAARDAGFSRFQWVVQTGEPREQPAPLVPELAHELEVAWAPLDGPGRQVMLADFMTREAEGCAPAVEMFRAVATASVEMKCPMLAAGLDGVWDGCPKQAPRIVTILQAINESTRPLGAVVTDCTAEGQTLEVAAELPWSELLPQLAERRGQDVCIDAAEPVTP